MDPTCRDRRSAAESCSLGGSSRSQGPHGIADGDELKLAEQAIESLPRPSQAAVVAQPRQPGHGDAWLIGIELPRMDVKSAGQATPLALTQCGSYQAIREKSEVSAAGCGQQHAAAPQRGRRDLGQRSG